MATRKSVRPATCCCHRASTGRDAALSGYDSIFASGEFAAAVLPAGAGRLRLRLRLRSLPAIARKDHRRQQAVVPKATSIGHWRQMMFGFASSTRGGFQLV